MRLAIILTLALCLVGCSNIEKNAITDLREYNVDDYITVVGVGKWDNNVFRITDYRGQKWDVPATANILEGPFSLESFKRANK